MKTYTASCTCGSVEIVLKHKPEFINDCNCSHCIKANGIWGYFITANVQVTGKTNPYVRPDRDKPVVEIHTCTKCLKTTHWLITQQHQLLSGISDQMGVNMNLFSKDDLRGVEMRFPDGKAWPGEGQYGYRKPAYNIGDKAP